MGLRGRLALFFVAITVVPLAVAVFALRLQIDRQLENRAAAELSSVREAALNIVSSARSRAGDLATDMVMRNVGGVLVNGDPAAAAVWLEGSVGQLDPDRADFAVLISADGRALAARRTESSPTPDQLAVAVVNAATLPTALMEVREVRGSVGGGDERLLGYVAVGINLDASLLQRLVVGSGVALVGDGVVLAHLGGVTQDFPFDSLPPDGLVKVGQIDGQKVLLSAASLNGQGEGGPARLVVWADPSADSSALGIALLVLLPSMAAAAVFGWLLASAIVGPIRRAADVARAVAEGDLSRTLEPTGGRELEELAVSLNTMSAELASRLDELARSRDQLRQSLSRLGQTLSSSLDLNRTLAVVVETAMDTFEAESSVLMLFTPERDALYVKVGRNVPDNLRRLRHDEGLAGHVARTALPVRLPADAGKVPEPINGELAGAQQITVPLLGRGRVMGVLTLTREEAGRPFSADDLDAIQTFGSQASGAIENVMLHHEARRLSVTDPLTGLWNFRYLQLQAERELESAERFERPMSLMIADLDLFKAINDQHGHQVGDDVLIEVAARLRDATRVPDVVARYGGEEFVVLLPGTDSEGAAATAERIRAAVAGVPIASSGVGIDGKPVQIDVSCSIGVASFPADGVSIAALLRNADAAMYAAKRGGRNRVVVAKGDMGEKPKGRGKRKA